MAHEGLSRGPTSMRDSLRGTAVCGSMSVSLIGKFGADQFNYMRSSRRTDIGAPPHSIGRPAGVSRARGSMEAQPGTLCFMRTHAKPSRDRWVFH
eukprot:scaffold90061_cov66-Phaeocystis_antarctica.AAC.19